MYRKVKENNEKSVIDSEIQFFY